MKTIVYISTAVTLLTDDVLLHILTAARDNNAKHQVTGVLLYADGTFIQALEGEPADVDAIYELIEQDKKHRNIIKLIDEPLAERNFTDWRMGFSYINNNEAGEIIGYLKPDDALPLRSDAYNPAVSIIKTFIENNNILISA
ncbi:BLUF domain-containing protein [Mucilaginibacter segetis]|uniref:BLUF domain-containing protein n=1 Tax=Mucilaginibacter segetis TaxID=2793071 RepID=A0A934PPZ8_9SPHI|nr:BLUF domain-containing protein [Mucilaginibacter segetis]MBK0378618.1 BLUF domain-containing protein [Mucilaginibacter segetis]